MMMTPWVLRLLVANVGVFVATMALPQLYRSFALVPQLALVRPWTLLTYMFLHAGIMHLLLNMIGLFFFGPRLEERLGTSRFLWLYFLSGIGGAVFSFVFAPGAPVVGASAAVFGVLLGFAYYWPRENIYIWGVLPIQARWLAVILVVTSLYSGIAGSRSGIAHFAHLGGLAFGFAYLKWSEYRAHRRREKALAGFRPQVRTGGNHDREARKRWEAIPLNRIHELNRDEVESLLEKVKVSGVSSLTTEERAFLDRMAGS